MRFELDQPHSALAVTPIAYSANASRWRSESMRSHSTARLMYFTQGQGRITIAGLTSGYGPNNVIYIPANTMYAYEIGPGVFGQVVTIPEAMGAEWPEDVVHLRLREVMAQREMITHIENLERELRSDESGNGRAAHYYIGILSVFFERQIELQEAQNETVSSASRTASARLVAAFTDLIEREYRNGWKISDYAAALGVTPTHLTRCCKQTSGKSALRLLNDRVLYEARRLLRETDAPVQEIASHLGFNSAAYFTRSFQNETGQTPSGFRKTGEAATRKGESLRLN